MRAALSRFAWKKAFRCSGVKRANFSLNFALLIFLSCEDKVDEDVWGTGVVFLTFFSFIIGWVCCTFGSGVGVVSFTVDSAVSGIGVVVLVVVVLVLFLFLFLRIFFLSGFLKDMPKSTLPVKFALICFFCIAFGTYEKCSTSLRLCLRLWMWYWFLSLL